MAKKQDSPVEEGAEPTKEAMAAEIAAMQAAPPAEPTAPPVEPPVEESKPETVKFTAADGTVYEAEDMQGLLAKLAAAREDTHKALKDRERQIHELRRAQEPPKKEATEAFDKGVYYKLMEEDPIEATVYLEKFKPESPESKVKKEFMAFYAETKYGEIETPELNAIFKERFTATGRTPTKENLKLTYLELKEDGKLPQPGKPAEQKKAPPLSATGSGGMDVSELPDFDDPKMTREEMRRQIEKMTRSGARPN